MSSSEVLLEEIRRNLVSPSFVSASKTGDEALNSAVVSEQVKLASLRRELELVLKLNAEFPDRIAKLEKSTSAVIEENRRLDAQERERGEEVKRIVARNAELAVLFESVCSQLRSVRENEAVSILQKERVWELIGRVVELRKALGRYLVKPAQSGGDFGVISQKIEDNDKRLKEVEAMMNEVVESRF